MRALTATATTTPVQLPNQHCVEAIIQADPNNANDLLIGDTTAQVLRLQPGDRISLTPHNLNRLAYKSSAGTATINVMWRES